jgi:hypothetical protein
MDGGYRGEEFMRWVMDTFRWIVAIVLRPLEKRGFVHLPKRWVVERTFGWLNWCRRLSVTTCNTNRSNLQSRLFQTRINCNYKYFHFSCVFNPLKAAALPPAFVPVIHAIALGRVVRETAI